MLDFANNQLQSMDAERSVLGALILDNDVYDRISDILAPADFFYAPHRYVYEHIQRLAVKGKPYDVVTLSDSLTSVQLPDQEIGLAYLAEIVNNTATAVNVKFYAEIVKNKAIKRKLSRALIESNTYLHENPTTAEEVILDKVEQNILSVRQDIEAGEDDFIPIKSIIPKIIAHLDAIALREDGLAGLTSGFIDLDKKLCGLRESQFIIIAGRPSMGKTTFAMNVAEAILTQTDRAVLFFSMEMSDRDIAERLCASMGKIAYSKIRSANLEDHDWQLLSATFDQIEKLDLTIVDKPALTPLQLKHKARKFKREQPNLGLIIVDYLQLMQCTGYEKNRTLEVSKISNELKALAKELNVPVIALSQLNRSVEERKDKKPMMSDLRDSGSIEQDADVVMFVHRDEVYDPDNPDLKGLANLIISKQRNGETGIIDLTFRGEFCRFENASFSHYTMTK